MGPRKGELESSLEVWAGLKEDRRVGSHSPDAEVVRAVGRGDSEAFEILVRRHLPAAHGMAMSLLRDSDDADDVCQDAFVSALKRIHQLRDPASFKLSLIHI